MKKRLSLLALAINFVIAFVASFLFAQAVPSANINPVYSAAIVTVGFATLSYFAPIYKGGLLMALQKEVWLADIKENPIPDTSFMAQSEDYSMFVENNTLHLQEAGVDPDVHLNYFTQNPDDQLPIQNISDILDR